MTCSDIKKLESFLKQRFGFTIPKNLSFRRINDEILETWLANDETIYSKIVNLSTNDFLTKDFLFDPEIENLVSTTIKEKNLKIYTGIVSYDGRGEAALATGGNTFNNLKTIEQKGLIKRFLTYQGDRDRLSPLAEYAKRQGIKIYFVDDIRLVDKEDELILDFKARGKTENILKFVLLLKHEISKLNCDPNKIFVLFMDDDYCLLDDRAHYILIASWVLSFANKANNTRIQKLIKNCSEIGFVKNGGVRIHISPYLACKILKGEVIKNYRSLIIETIKLELDLGESGAEVPLPQLNSMLHKLENLPTDLILTPENINKNVSTDEINLIQRIMRKYYYAGGRVTKPFTRKNVHESENFLSNWLGLFTFILHGDQGTTLSNWLSLKLGQGYAFDSSVIIQFLLDEHFAQQRIIDIRNTPHAHQPQEQPAVEGMEDLINLVVETLRVYYDNWDVDSFISRYQKRTRVSWLPDGRYLRTKVQPEQGILFYPPAEQLLIS